MRLKGDSYFFMVIMAIMLVIIGLSLRMEQFASKLLPLVISSIVFILSAIRLGRDISTRGKRRATVAEGEISKTEETREDWHSYLVAGSWGLGFFLAVYLLGFIISIPLFILTYMKAHGTRWFVVGIFAILMPLLIYGVFELVLRVTLYRGLLFT